MNDPVHMARWQRRLRELNQRDRRRCADYAAVLAYDGRTFAGYARQPDQTTIEGCLRKALASYIVDFRRLVVAGRTDRGVSATAQVVSFRGYGRQSLDAIRHRINAAAPHALWCRSVQFAPHGFHAQFWAERRRYQYLHPASKAEQQRTLVIDQQLRNLEGHHCMYAFSRATPEGAQTVRRIYHARCRTGHVGTQPVLVFDVEAQGFLRRMMRVLVATALDQSRVSSSPIALRRLTELGDRSLTAEPAPPEPLRFVSVTYPQWTPVVRL